MGLFPVRSFKAELILTWPICLEMAMVVGCIFFCRSPRFDFLQEFNCRNKRVMSSLKCLTCSMSIFKYCFESQKSWKHVHTAKMLFQNVPSCACLSWGCQGMIKHVFVQISAQWLPHLSLIQSATSRIDFKNKNMAYQAIQIIGLPPSPQMFTLGKVYKCIALLLETEAYTIWITCFWMLPFWVG